MNTELFDSPKPSFSDSPLNKRVFVCKLNDLSSSYGHYEKECTNSFLHSTYFEISGRRCSSLFRLKALGGFCGPVVEPLMNMHGALD